MFSSLEKLEHCLPDLKGANAFFIELLAEEKKFFSTLQLINKISTLYPQSAVIVFSDDESAEKTMNGAFSAGADDFITKPLRRADLTTRAFYRKESKKTIAVVHDKFELLTFEDLTINIRKQYLANDDGKHVDLDRKEFLMMYSFIQSPNIIITKKTLKLKLWANTKVTASSFEKKLFSLRKKIISVSSKVDIKSCYGKGLILQKKEEGIGDTMMALDILDVNIKNKKRMFNENP